MEPARPNPGPFLLFVLIAFGVALHRGNGLIASFFLAICGHVVYLVYVFVAG
jgi:hypothetical protein